MTNPETFDLRQGHTISRVIKGGWQLSDGHSNAVSTEPVADMFAFAERGIDTFDCADIYTGVEDLIGAFLRENAAEIWGCDFFTVPTALFGQLHVWLLIQLQSREIVHWAVTKHPTDAWIGEQFHAAAQKRPPPRYLVRDGDGKYGRALAAALAEHGVQPLKTPYRTPRANAFAEQCKAAELHLAPIPAFGSHQLV